MTEDEKKIQTWRHEQYNHTMFGSQEQYRASVRRKDEIQVGVLRGYYPSVTAVALTLEVQLGFGRTQARVLASKYWMQRQLWLSGESNHGIPERIMKEVKRG